MEDYFKIHKMKSVSFQSIENQAVILRLVEGRRVKLVTLTARESILKVSRMS